MQGKRDMKNGAYFSCLFLKSEITLLKEQNAGIIIKILHGTMHRMIEGQKVDNTNDFLNTHELQLQALGSDKVGVCVIDCQTKEVYYSNAANFYLHGVEECDYRGKCCFDVFGRKICSCDDCWMDKPDVVNGKEIFHPIPNGKVLSITAETKRWKERDILIFYMRDVTEQYQINQTLKRTQEAMEEACNFAGMWMWIYDMEHDCIYPSLNLQHDYEMPEKLENFPQSWFDLGFITPDYVEFHRQKVQAIKAGSEKEEFECQVMHKDGSLHWSRIRFNRLKNDPKFAVGTAQIIDTEKTQQARLEIEKQRILQKDKNLMGYVITNISRDRVLERDEVNQSNIPLTKVGLSLEEAMKLARTHLPEEEWQRYRLLHDSKKLLKLYQEGTTEMEQEGHCIKKSGEVIWVRTVYNLLKDPSSGDILLYEYIYDIHAQKMMEEIVHAMVGTDYERTASINIDANQMTVLLENNTIEIWDYEKQAKNYCDTVVLEEDRGMFCDKTSLDNIRREMKDKDQFEFVCRTKEEDGSVRMKRTLFSYYNREMRVCLMARVDITQIIQKEEEDRAKLEQALLVAQAATKAKSEFLSRMSHEIRTPMNAIMGMTAIAQDNKSDFIQVSDCLNKIDLSSHYLLTLLNDILEMSRIESGQTIIHEEEFDFSILMESIRTIVEALASQNDIRYECVNKANLDYFYKGDRLRIQQVMVNLITNAIKFTKPGGRVRFTIECEEQDEKQMLFHFAIADTGIGMSEEFMEKMFKPFTQEDGSNTSKYQGSGLGLAISKSLIEMMGGSITVESFLGIGSTFKINLPLKRMKKSYLYTIAKQAESTPRKMGEQALKGCRILIAEDHPLNVMIAKKLLESKGMIVTVADNGKMAVDTFAASKPYYFDAILMDIRMPVMDGLKATEQIRILNREDAATIPIIAMTANALDEDRKKTKKAGMDAHLAKPFEPKQLYATLLEWIHKEP